MRELTKFGKSATYKTLTVASGGLGAGISSVIAGGNFWDGARQGLITAGLNHVMHGMFDDGGGDKKPKPKAQKQNNDPYQQSDGQKVYSLEEFTESNAGLTRDEIINQLKDRSWIGESQKGGPTMRYVRNPNDGRVIDMRHMLVVGPEGPIVGLGVEVFQWATGQPSGMNPQDFYSNDLGFDFSGYQRLYRLNIPSNYTKYLYDFFKTSHYYNK